PDASLGSTNPTPSTPAPSTPAATTPTVTPPAEPATTPAPVLTTAQAAAEHLYNAWKAGDKPTALQGASQAAVDALFSKAWKDGTYFCGVGSDDTQCQYNFAAGVINMTISGNASAGFTVTAVDRGNAG